MQFQRSSLSKSIALNCSGFQFRQTQKRTENEQHWTSASIGIAMMIGMITSFALVGVGYRISQNNQGAVARNVYTLKAQTAAASIHPTALPWIGQEAACKGKSRHWEEGLCYEQDHDPQF